MTDKQTTHEEVEAAYGTGSYEWIVAVKAEVERQRKEITHLKAELAAAHALHDVISTAIREFHDDR